MWAALRSQSSHRGQRSLWERRRRAATGLIERSAQLGEAVCCFPEQCHRLSDLAFGRTQFGARLADGSVPGPPCHRPVIRSASARCRPARERSPARANTQVASMRNVIEHGSQTLGASEWRFSASRATGNASNERSAAQSCTPSTRTIRCDGIPDDSARGRARSSSSRARSRLPRATGDEMPPSASRTWIRPVFSS
jgi:hypothetical protein